MIVHFPSTPILHEKLPTPKIALWIILVKRRMEFSWFLTCMCNACSIRYVFTALLYVPEGITTFSFDLQYNQTKLPTNLKNRQIHQRGQQNITKRKGGKCYKGDWGFARKLFAPISYHLIDTLKWLHHPNKKYVKVTTFY